MSQSRPFDLAKIPGDFKSTDARCYVAFAKGFYKIPDKALDSSSTLKTLKKASRFNAQFGGLSANLASLRDHDSIKAKTIESIDRLKASPNPAAKQPHKELNELLAEELKRSENLQKELQLFLKKYQE